MILVAKNWKDYELIDAGVGEKLERWGKYYFIRPDPQVIWPRAKKVISGQNLMQNILEVLKAEALGKKIENLMHHGIFLIKI